MESILKCATLHENFHWSLKGGIAFPHAQGAHAAWEEVVEIIQVFCVDSFCLTVNS
jgi:hypothetical protein